MQNFQQYPQYPYQGQPLPPVSATLPRPQSPADAIIAARHPLAPLATVSFWSTIVQRTLQVNEPVATSASLAATVVQTDQLVSSATPVTHPQTMPNAQLTTTMSHQQPLPPYNHYYPPFMIQNRQTQPQPQTDLLSLILGIPPPVLPTSLAPPPERVSSPYYQHQQIHMPPQPIHQQSSSFIYQQYQQPQPVPVQHQHTYWPVAQVPPQHPAPTATSLTHDFGISLLHLAIAAARFGFKATTALTHFIISNPLTRPIAHLWIHALKQLAAFAVHAVKLIVHAMVTGGQPQPQPQQSIMGVPSSSGDGTAAMASMMMQLASAAAGSGMMGSSSARW